uniref:DNA translocase FtsK 4TM domain-containing protein n=1 Tax=Roseovarius salis TaxID=3376063 RepID=UPI0037C7B432
MAFQTRGRDPLLDSSMAEAIEKRGKELAGLLLMALGAMAAATVLSYHPDDPSWMSATDAPVRNWMGHAGASVAVTLFMVIGWAAAGIALAIFGWGVRLGLHRGEERAVGRLIFLPIWLAVLSLFAASFAPGPQWSAAHSFGLGGLFGDTVLATLLGLLPLGPGAGLKLLTFVLAALSLGLGLFVLGFSRQEVKRIARFLLVGLVMTYAGLRALLGQGATGAARASAGVSAGVRHGMEARRQRRAERQQ